MLHAARAEGLSSATMRALRDYWLGVRGARQWPARQDIDPLHVPKLLRHMVLTDVLHDPLRLRYRLIGSFVTELAGRDATGRGLDAELYGERTEDMLWAYRQCLDRLGPVAVREKVQFVAKDWVAVEALLMPVGEPDQPPNLVLSGVDFAAPGAALPPAGTSFVLDWRLG